MIGKLDALGGFAAQRIQFSVFHPLLPAVFFLGREGGRGGMSRAFFTAKILHVLLNFRLKVSSLKKVVNIS
jgi:hypothetical protein